ncbi:MAG: adenosylcobinamide-phosphate synthase CbiB [Methanomassiliicoccaceae archaeon]|nr:adenosylcobinamide-phosphate synthase CbiB [Methanomassiliicoccaceae archaeon]
MLAFVIDAVIGDVPNAIHPLRWMGNLLDKLDKRIKRKNRRSSILKGFLSYALVLFIFAFISLTILAVVRTYAGDAEINAGILGTTSIGEIIWIIICAFLFKLTFAVFSFRRHCRPIQKDLEKGDNESAASRTQMIVSRNTKGMDAEHIASSCAETISENYADSVCSPTFFYGVFGIFGAWMFRCCNLMDAMWGYLNDKYRDLGYFPAKFDDVLGYLTSRISVLFIALASVFVGGSPRKAISTAAAEHKKTPSPNSGWPMTAAAGALGFRMEKEGVYVMGTGELPSVKDISRCYVLVEIAAFLFLLIVTVPLYMFIGIHIQIYMENAIIGLFGAIF